MQPNGSMGCAERVGWMLAVTFSGAQFLPPTCQLQSCSKEQSHFLLYDCLAGAQPSHHGTGSSFGDASGSHQGQLFSHGRSRPGRQQCPPETEASHCPATKQENWQVIHCLFLPPRLPRRLVGRASLSTSTFLSWPHIPSSFLVSGSHRSSLPSIPCSQG